VSRCCHATTRSTVDLTDVPPVPLLVAARNKNSKQLVSHDQHSSTYVYKHTVVLDLVPVCKDDLVFLPSKLANVIGGISPLCIVHRVSTYIYVVDPTTLQTAEISGEKYWKYPFTPVLVRRRLRRAASSSRMLMCRLKCGQCIGCLTLAVVPACLLLLLVC
jgi:hypothetical protein